MSRLEHAIAFTTAVAIATGIKAVILVWLLSSADNVILAGLALIAGGL